MSLDMLHSHAAPVPPPGIQTPSDTPIRPSVELINDTGGARVSLTLITRRVRLGAP